MDVYHLECVPQCRVSLTDSFKCCDWCTCRAFSLARFDVYRVGISFSSVGLLIHAYEGYIFECSAESTLPYGRSYPIRNEASVPHSAFGPIDSMQGLRLCDSIDIVKRGTIKCWDAVAHSRTRCCTFRSLASSREYAGREWDKDLHNNVLHR